MEKLGGLLVVVGVLLLAYSILGTFVRSPMIFSYIRPIRPSTGVGLANGLFLLGVLCKLYKK